MARPMKLSGPATYNRVPISARPTPVETRPAASRCRGTDHEGQPKLVEGRRGERSAGIRNQQHPGFFLERGRGRALDLSQHSQQGVRARTHPQHQMVAAAQVGASVA